MSRLPPAFHPGALLPPAARRRGPAAAVLPIPGARFGERPERRPPPPGFHEQANAWLRSVHEGGRGLLVAAGVRVDAGFVAQVRASTAAAQAAWATGESAWQTQLAAVRAGLLREGLCTAAAAQALGVVAAAAQRSLGLRPFDSQLIAARALLEGRLAEMATGEGKTLTVALAAASAAVAGVPVHVITANDYLVARDAAAFAPLYAALGLRSGAVVQADAPARRRAAYACDITVVTAKELVFDHLRDGLLPAPERALRGLCMAIVDEADGILIDEARVPLILSQPVDAAESAAVARCALALADGLKPGEDFLLRPEALTAELMPMGRARVQAAVQVGDTGAWRHPAHREHAVCTALAARHLLQRDRHYLVHEAAVQLIDDTTGRVAAGRAWSNGLQALVEIKEGLVPTAPLATVAQLTYPKFFTRYHHLCGLSGTLREARGELRRSYGLLVRRIPLRRPCRRRVGPHRLFASHAALCSAVAERVAALHAAGRPVLVAAESVADAQALSAQLAMRGLVHRSLHAATRFEDAGEEAALVSRAGRAGAITVSTNMAGRGTDIVLDEAARAAGGLHVLCCQLNASRRIDRQLAGRAARQGDPGSAETWLSLDAVLLRGLPAFLARLAHRLPDLAVRALARGPQRREEARQREQRRRLAARDVQRQRQLGFAGPGE